MKNLKLTQKASKDAEEKKVWTLIEYTDVSDLQTHVADSMPALERDCFWTGFKLVTRSREGFDKVLSELGIKFVVTTEAVTKSKESDIEVLARMLGLRPAEITPEFIANMKTSS